MNLNKLFIEPLDEYLNNWYSSLPFQALNEIFGVDLFDKDWEETLRFLEEDWLNMSIEDKVGIHSEYWEKWEGWTSHLITPSLYIPYDDLIDD